MLNYLLEISALLANRVVADVVMKVDELLSVEVFAKPGLLRLVGAVGSCARLGCCTLVQ